MAVFNPNGSDPINSPAHYTQGQYETIDIIKDMLNSNYLTPFGAYCMGNAIKYISRCTHKGGAEDIKKAQKYLDWLAGEMETSLDGWNLVNKQLPEREGYYLVTLKSGKIEYCYFVDLKWFLVADGEGEKSWVEEIKSVMAWRMLPEPCTGGGK